jgi:hypothetical protein
MTTNNVQQNTPASGYINGAGASSMCNGTITTLGSGGYSSIGATTASTVYSNGAYGVIANGQVGGSQFIQDTEIIAVYGADGVIVSLNIDGKVTWAEGYTPDDAAEKFAQSLRLSSELAAGITATSKANMRDSVFNDIIEIAKAKGPLSVDDLTYLLSASKIVERLKV